MFFIIAFMIIFFFTESSSYNSELFMTLLSSFLDSESKFTILNDIFTNSAND